MTSLVQNSLKKLYGQKHLIEHSSVTEPRQLESAGVSAVLNVFCLKDHLVSHVTVITVGDVMSSYVTA